ncbi:MAG: hypothetical protein EXS35_11870 [Pedosphaera sp.]|nr:hypothetical protein [Pedosphaera sp.]
MIKHIRSFLAAISFTSAILLGPPQCALAGSHTWSGATSGNWSVAGNWSAGGVPTLAETNSFTFPAGATRTLITNNIGALKVSAITFSGSNYIIRGSSTFTVELNLLNFIASGGSNTIESSLSFVSIGSITVGSSSTLVLAGALSGTNGLSKFGAGDLFFRGAASNPLSGGLNVNSGALHFQKTGVASPYSGNSISIGSTDVGDPTQLFLYADNQIPDGADLNLNPSGALYLNGFSDIVNSVTMHSGYLDTGAGTLGIGSALNLSPRFVGGITYESPTLYGILEFHGTACTISVSSNLCSIDASVVENGTVTALNKTGSGTLRLKSANTFTGQLNIQQGAVQADLSTSLGSVAGSTVVSNGAALIISSGVNTSEPLVLSGLGTDGQGALKLTGGTGTCSGTITLGSETGVSVATVNATLNLDGPINGGGGIRKFGDGALFFNGFGNNAFSGASFVAKGKLTLNKGANVRAIGSVTVTNGASLVFINDELMDNAGVLSIYTGGSVNLTNRNETIGGLNMGAGVTVDSGTGTLTLLGDTFVGAPYSTTNSIFAVVKGRLSLGGALRKFSSTPGSSALTLDCEVLNGSGTGGIWLTNGSIYLLRSNSFSGPVIIKGFCGVSNSFAFGAPGGGVTLTNEPFTGTTLALLSPTMTVTGEALTNLSSSYLAYAGTNAWNGPIVTSNNLVFDGGVPANQMTVDGSISGSGSPWVYGGTLRLLQANSYAGVTEVYGGPLVVRHPQALGTSAGGTLLNEGATLRLELPNGAAITNESLTFEYNGLTGHMNNLILVVGAVSNTWTGPITLPIPAQVRVEDGAGTFVIASTISGPGSLEKQGPGSLILAGSNANTYSGETVVSDGTLRLNKPNGVQATGNLTVNHPGKVVWAANEQIANTATLTLSLYNFGVTNTHANLGNHTETFTQLTMTNTGASLFASSGGTLNLLGDITLASGVMFIDPTLVFPAGTHQITGDNNAYAHFFGSLRETGGSAGLKFTDCDVFLAASNSFSGPLVLDNGQFTIQHPAALGTSAGSTTLTNYSLLYLDLPADAVVAGEALILATLPIPDSGYEIRMYNHVTNTWTGPITIQERCRILHYETDGRLVVTGPVTGTGSLLCSTAGTLVLAGNTTNSFNGLTAGQGSVRLAKPPGVPAIGGDVLIEASFSPLPKVILDGPGQLPATTTVNIGAGGTFDLNGHATTIRRLLGAGTVNIGTGTLTFSNSVAQYSGFLGLIQGAPGSMNLVQQGIGQQRVGLFALQGSMSVAGGTIMMDNGSIGALDISAGALMDMYAPVAHFGSLSGAGSIYTAGNGMIFVGANNLSTTYSGVIFGGSQTNIVKVGTGVLTLTGTNTDTGTTLIQNGKLLVNGSLRGSVRVQPGGVGQFPTLGGVTTLGNVVVIGIGASIAPGATTNIPSYGKLTVTNIAIVDGALYLCEIGGTNAGVNLDQIDAKDTFTLAGVSLTNGAASFTAFGAGVVSNRYAVVKSFAPVNGTFQGDPEGDYIYPAAGRLMQITYLSAGGKEIFLTDLVQAANSHIGGITMQTNRQTTLTGTGIIGATYIIEANTNLAMANWLNIGTVQPNFNGDITFTDTNAPALSQRFYRFRQQ